MKRKSPVQILMDKMNARVNFKYVNVEEWEDVVKELELCEELFALEITYAYSAGYKHGVLNKSEVMNGVDYYEKRFK